MNGKVTGSELWNWRKDSIALADVQRAGEYTHGGFINLREFFSRLRLTKNALKRAIKRADKKDKALLGAVLLFLDRSNSFARTDENVKEHVYDVLRDAHYIYDCDFALREKFPVYAFETLLHHDDGEALGDESVDKADDGSKQKADDEEEIALIEDLLRKYYPKGMVNYIIDNIIHFKHSILYLFDKGDWVFRCFLKEYRRKQGVKIPVGSLRYKEIFYGLSEQDKHAIEITGSYNLTDAMVVHFIEHSFCDSNTYKSYVKPIPGRDLYLDAFRAAYIDIRGEVPEWFEKHVSEFIPPLDSL